MKPSEMTNEELANELDNVLVNDELQTFADVDRQVEALREAAARLRNVTIRSDNSKVIAELQRRLKVAEDALMYARNSITRDCYNDCDHVEECASAHGRCKCVIEDKIEAAIAEIHKEGKNDQGHEKTR